MILSYFLRCRNKKRQTGGFSLGRLIGINLSQSKWIRALGGDFLVHLVTTGMSVKNLIWLVVWNIFYFPILGIIIPID